MVKVSPHYFKFLVSISIVSRENSTFHLIKGGLTNKEHFGLALIITEDLSENRHCPQIQYIGPRGKDGGIVWHLLFGYFCILSTIISLRNGPVARWTTSQGLHDVIVDKFQKSFAIMFGIHG